MTKNHDYIKLYRLLEKAAVLSSKYSGGYSERFLSAEEFHSGLSESIKVLKAGDTYEINKLYLWFAPTSDWNDYIGQEGEKLANEIFSLLSEIKDTLEICNLVDLINDYQNAVNSVINAFKVKYNRTDLITAYRQDKLYSKEGDIKEHGIKQYSFHGIGLRSTFNDNSVVDFDFAFIPEQRHDGFDLWRLRDFITNQPSKYEKFLDKQKLENDFNNLIEKGIIVKPDIEFSTALYFFKSDL